ncbi:thioredoxin-2 isoform X1 [Nasonia vitripennis]|uniref:Thioredoxin domain-containing protein n=1 Tax=Nasonia vitripennis TaxID=7425 RepID=A0A7M7LJ68_NASVI|nr:thioredoxin-2 isoform X1 [Nasonia vitripennis]
MQSAIKRVLNSRKMLNGIFRRKHSLLLQPIFLEELKTKLTEAGEKLVVIDFFATWCGPCKMIAPKLDELSQELTDVVFLKVDVDELEGVAEEYDVNSMPTFVFIKNGSVLDKFSGANIEKVKLTVQKHK